nr:uncharacterized protein LOC128702348 [Cherax quadricarinatus]
MGKNKKKSKNSSSKSSEGYNAASSQGFFEEMFSTPNKQKRAGKQNTNKNQEYPQKNCNKNNYCQGQQDSIPDNKWKENHGNGKSQHYANNTQDREPRKKNNSSRDMDCEVCRLDFNATSNIPRILNCGHSLCTPCLKQILKNNSVSCPTCRSVHSKLHSAGDVPKNFSLIKLIEDNARGNFTVAGGSKSTGSNSSKNASSNWSSTPPKTKEISPHKSKCILTPEVTLSCHCSKCQVWLCMECGRIDHSSGECFVTPYKETLSEMIQVKKSEAEAAGKNLKESKNEICSYQEKLASCSLALQITGDCIKREQKRVEDILEDGKAQEVQLQSVVSYMSEAKDLSSVLEAFKTVDHSIGETRQWASREDFAHTDRKIQKLLKELLRMILQLHSASRSVFAMFTINSTQVFSGLKCEGNRIHVPSLKQLNPSSQTRAVPFEYVKQCIDSASALTFLELSWGGSCRGRVYIRLIGDTVRGRQFLRLCTGEMGPSFCKSLFHRVWWKGLPGEHVWGGDHDKGNGSGGTSIVESSEYVKLSAAGRRLPITAGLVAGCYEKEKVSSIFRIYTKDSKSAEEEAAFGQVEYGLNTIESALNHNYIRDVIISDCGVVIEL